MTPDAVVASDDAPSVLACGAGDVQVAVVSMSARSPDGDDADYLRWHGEDHLPEQYRIDGLRHGTRWVSTEACRAVRLANEPPFDAVDHVVQYLMAEPVEPTLATFFALGKALRDAGRMPMRLPPVELGGYRIAETAASPEVLVGAAVLPWRPARGVYLLVEEGVGGIADLVEVDGVAGAWQYEGSATLHERLAPTDGRRLTVLYLHGDPAATGARLRETLQARWSAHAIVPLLAAPFVAVDPLDWNRSLP